MNKDIQVGKVFFITGVPHIIVKVVEEGRYPITAVTYPILFVDDYEDKSHVTVFSTEGEVLEGMAEFDLWLESEGLI